jgi:BirA family biotin operon repressor/biotin-[acetyl-CoA-carboxylase] ligase
MYALPPIIFYPELNSTQDKAWEFHEKGFEKIVIIARKQTTGHGRHGRTWFSPKGGLWFSYLRTINVKPEMLDLISLACGISVALTLKSLDLNALIKWPNDVMVNDKKIAGILIDVKFIAEKIVAIVIGVGLNLNLSINEFPDDLKKQITTVFNELKYYVDEIKVLTSILKNIDTFLDNIDSVKPLIHENARRLNYLKNKLVKILLSNGKTIEDIAEDIDENGRLKTVSGLTFSMHDVLYLY